MNEYKRDWFDVYMDWVEDTDSAAKETCRMMLSIMAFILVGMGFFGLIFGALIICTAHPLLIGFPALVVGSVYFVKFLKWVLS